MDTVKIIAAEENVAKMDAEQNNPEVILSPHELERLAKVDHPEEAIKFLDHGVRADFAGKVYGLVMLQVLVMEAMVCCIWTKGLSSFMETFIRNWIIFTLGLGLVYFLLLVVVMCFFSTMRRFPFSFILMVIGNLLMSVVLALVAHIFGLREMAVSLAIAFVIFLALTLFTCQSRIDFIGYNSMLLVFVLVALLYLLPVLLLPRLNKKYLGVTALGVLLMGCLIVYDIKHMVRGTHELAISPNDCILVSFLVVYAEIVYTDIFYIDFLYTIILHDIVMKCRRSLFYLR